MGEDGLCLGGREAVLGVFKVGSRVEGHADGKVHDVVLGVDEHDAVAAVEPGLFADDVADVFCARGGVFPGEAGDLVALGVEADERVFAEDGEK